MATRQIGKTVQPVQHASDRPRKEYSPRPPQSTQEHSHEVTGYSANFCPALNILADPCCIAGSDGAPIFFNDAWRGYASGDSAGFASSEWQDWIHPADRHRIEPALGASGLPFEADIRLRHPDGDRWFLLRVHHQTDERGNILSVYILTDIHTRKLRELDLDRRAKLQTDMLNASVDCIKVINPDGTLSHMNKAGCAALNVSERSGFGMDWLPLLPQEAHEPGAIALDQAVAGSTARFLGVSQLPGENMRYWDNMLTPLMNAYGAVDTILCVSRDVTAQRESERRIDVLLHELNHRSKNMLTVIQALIRRTVPDPKAAFLRILDQRIASIAKSQDLLINGQWTGATVHDLVISQTAVAGDVQETRLLLKGDPDLCLHTRTAEVIGLAMHELTTNAVKYGALSNDVGTVTVSWDIEERRDGAFFHLRWKEAGGPRVKQPSRRGFGTLVIERNPLAVRGAAVDFAFEADGICWQFEAPVTNVIAGTEPDMRSISSIPPAGPKAGGP